MVKYPLLLRQVLKFSTTTPVYTADTPLLSSAIDNLEFILHDIDRAMAEAKANFTISRLEWLDEAVEAKYAPIVAQAKEEVLSGTLRNNRGTVSVQIYHTKPYYNSNRNYSNKKLLLLFNVSMA